MFLLRLFGTVSIEGPNGVVTGRAARRHALALLALLALSHSRRLSRDKLIGYLWPESGSSHARNLLNQSIHALRRALGQDALRSEGDELALKPDAVTCDVWTFEKALASGDAERAVQLYVGPLGDGFFLAGSIDFERWADGERERFRRGYLKALEELAEGATVLGDVEGAAEWWRRLTAEEPYNSKVTLGLMQTLEAAGDRAGAIRESEAHAERLQGDLGAVPSPAVLALAERMRTQPAVGPRRASAPPEASAAPPAAPGERAASAPERYVVASRRERVRVAGTERPWKRAAIVAAGLALLAAGGWAVTKAPERHAHDIRRMAVLPLVNFTGDPQQEYFVGGLHDALITELARIAALTVISRQSVIRYRNSDLPLPAIARALGVEALVEGSVLLAGDSVRITVQLVRAEPEEHVWAGTYYGEMRNSLALQGEMARAIARAIHASVTPEMQTHLTNERSVDPRAQEAYLKGLYYLEQLSNTAATPDSLPRFQPLARRIGLPNQADAGSSTPETYR